MNRNSRTRAIPCLFLALCWLSFDSSHAQEGVELTAEERAQAVASLREYQASFVGKRIYYDVQCRGSLGPPVASPPRKDFTVTIEGKKNHMMALQGPQLFRSFSVEADIPEGEISVQYYFDAEAGRGFSVIYRDGKPEQVSEFCSPQPPASPINHYLVNILGWDEQDTDEYKVRMSNLADQWESTNDVRRVAAADGETQIVVRRERGEASYVNLCFSDLPDVRLQSINTVARNQSGTRVVVTYQTNADGLMFPHRLRRVSIGPADPVNGDQQRILATEEAVVVDFSVVPASEAGPFPTIEIPVGVKVVDECRDQQTASAAVPEPVPSDDN